MWSGRCNHLATTGTAPRTDLNGLYICLCAGARRGSAVNRGELDFHHSIRRLDVVKNHSKLDKLANVASKKRYPLTQRGILRQVS